jgi:malonyl CoA-acyl carrier protein transacylase
MSLVTIRYCVPYCVGVSCANTEADEMSRSQESSNVDKAEYSQALCTVLQVATVNLLHRFGIRPSAAVGHSSGEIAAA